MNRMGAPRLNQSYINSNRKVRWQSYENIEFLILNSFACPTYYEQFQKGKVTLSERARNVLKWGIQCMHYWKLLRKFISEGKPG